MYPTVEGETRKRSSNNVTRGSCAPGMMVVSVAHPESVATGEWSFSRPHGQDSAEVKERCTPVYLNIAGSHIVNDQTVPGL